MKPWIAGLTALALSVALAGAAAAQPGGGGNPLVRKACQADIEQFCGSTEPGGGRLGQCLREHEDRLSEACKTAITDMRARRRQHGPATATPSSPSEASPPDSTNPPPAPAPN